MRLLAPLVCLALTGCITSQEGRVAYDDRQCRSYGVQPGTQAYVHCRLQLDQGRDVRRIVNSATLPGLIQNMAEPVNR